MERMSENPRRSERIGTRSVVEDQISINLARSANKTSGPRESLAKPRRPLSLRVGKDARGRRAHRSG